MSGIAIVTIGPKQWEVYLADTYEEIIQGLGEVIGISPQTGMFFDLGYDQVITVTTVPMLFPLDVVFISSDMRVADLARDVPPGVMVASDNFARYLLEVNAGEAAGVQIGDEVHVQVLVYPAEIGIPPPPPPSMDDIVNFGMTVTAILFMGSIARTAIEGALAPPKPEKKLLIAERKLLPPGEGGKLEHLPQVDKELTGKWFDRGIESYVWIRLGDRGNYERFDGPFNAGEAVGDRLAHTPEEHLILVYHYRSAGVEIEPYFVGDNYISLFWGDEDAQWIRDLSGDEHREFERGVRYGLTPDFLPKTVDERRKAEDIGKKTARLLPAVKEYGRIDWMPRKKVWRVIWYKNGDLPMGDFPTHEEAVDRLQGLIAEEHSKPRKGIGIGKHPRLIGRIRHPETPERLEFFADSRDHIEDSIESNGLHPQLEAIFMEAITRAKGERLAKRMMGD